MDYQVIWSATQVAGRFGLVLCRRVSTLPKTLEGAF